jgi:hypothetical protein
VGSVIEACSVIEIFPSQAVEYIDQTFPHAWFDSTQQLSVSEITLSEMVALVDFIERIP